MAKGCVLEQKLLLTAYRGVQSGQRGWDRRGGHVTRPELHGIGQSKSVPACESVSAVCGLRVPECFAVDVRADGCPV